jgi:hypothetical protein
MYFNPYYNKALMRRRKLILCRVYIHTTHYYKIFQIKIQSSPSIFPFDTNIIYYKIIIMRIFFF